MTQVSETIQFQKELAQPSLTQGKIRAPMLAFLCKMKNFILIPEIWHSCSNIILEYGNE